MVTVDELISIFSQTIGSFKGSLGISVGLWLTQGDLSNLWKPPTATVCVAVVWTGIVTLIRILLFLNSRLISGAPLHLNPKNDVVVITGGSNGLGLLVAAMFSTNGFTVVNMDVEKPAIDLARTTWVKADVRDPQIVAEVAQHVVNNWGVPTVLINCAGIIRGGPLISQSPKDVSDVFLTNFCGPLWSIQQFVPHMIERAKNTKQAAMVVGIGSATALANPAGAGIYSASKAALHASYESLRQELSGTGVRVLTVIPGQLDTRMFQSVETPSAFWAPVLSSHELASDVYRFTCLGRQGLVTTPFYVTLLPYVLLLLPQALVDWLRRRIGVDTAMRSFVSEQHPRE